MKNPITLYALMEQMENPLQWNIVGWSDPVMGTLPVVSVQKHTVDTAYQLLKTKHPNAKIVKLVEVDENH